MKAALCLIVALGYLAYAYAMPAKTTQKEEKNDVTFDIDPNMFLSFLEATDPNLALKVLPKILGITNMQNIRKQVQDLHNNLNSKEDDMQTNAIIKDLDTLIEKNQEISVKVDRSLFLHFLEATDPQLALKALPKILGKSDIHLMRRHVANLFDDHQMFGDQAEADKKKIFRLY